jgi:putative MATE family efflux protein
VDQRTRLLLEGPVTRTLLRLALPNVVVMAVQASIGLIETFFVARLGLDALAGMALVFPVLMLLQTISAGAMGGGILSAVARALGSGNQAKALELFWSAVAITLVLGAATSALVLLLGPSLYRLMGGRDGSLDAAVLYSGIVFAGAIPLWLFNSLAAVIRGTGNMSFPAKVVAVGALLLIPISPLLIFGIGPLPRLGIAGGAIAVVLYYVIGCFVFGWYLWAGRGVLKVRGPSRISLRSIWDISRVGLASSVVSTSTNVTIVIATGLAGLVGPAAVAGYGTGVRLEYMLIPIVFGLGAPMAAMVGTAIGAGMHRRAKQVAWIGAAMAGLLTEIIGLSAALLPLQWLSLFGHDAEMLATGTSYLQIVGPTYGFFGAGLALYFAAQGAGRVTWPMLIGVMRVLVAAGGGWIAIRILKLGSADLFAVLAAGMAGFGVANALAMRFVAWGDPPARKLARPSVVATHAARG